MLRATLPAVVVAGLLAAGGLAEAQEPPDPAAGLEYHTVTPCRLIDTRLDPAGPLVTDTAVQGGSVGNRSFQVKGSCGVPFSAKAVALNLTVPVRDLAFRGHMVAYAADIALPPTSNVNLTPGTTEQNFGIVALASRGVKDFQIHLFLLDDDVPSLGGVAHAVIDVVGFFKPKPY